MWSNTVYDGETVVLNDCCLFYSLLYSGSSILALNEVLLYKYV